MARPSTLSGSNLLPSTFMPYFDLHHSASASSTNTRQREDFEEQPTIKSQATFTSSVFADRTYNIPTSPESDPHPSANQDNDDDDDDEVRDRAGGALGISRSSSMTVLASSPYRQRALSASSYYPASELPFASEPALETELDPELPPLKKLKPTRFNQSGDGDDLPLFHDPDSRVVIINVVKGILTKRDSHHGQNVATGCLSWGAYHSGSPTRFLEPTSIINQAGPASISPLSFRITNHHTGASSDPLPHQHHSEAGDQRPLSRRSSSAQSAISSSAQSIKAVRFASGNGFFSYQCDHHTSSSDDEGSNHHKCCLGLGGGKVHEVEGPVAAVMYLTHSADTYDRSPIVVETSLRLPPRQDANECGRWVMTHDSSHHNETGSGSGRRRSTSEQTVRGSKPKKQSSSNKLSLTPPLTLAATTTSPSPDPELSFLSSHHTRHLIVSDLKSREQPSEDDDDDDEEGDKQTEVDDDEEDENENQSRKDDDDDDDDDEICGLGTWSRGDVFSYDDALGGF